MRALWRNRCFWSDAQTVRLTLAPDAFARALRKMATDKAQPGTEAHAWLFMGTPLSEGHGRTDIQQMVTALPPSTSQRAARLSAMGSGVAHPPASGGNWRSWAGNGRAAAAAMVLTVVLVPLVAVLFAAIFYLTAMAMTLGLAAGLALLVSLV
jgi:phosphodiesterase/alkaline phosphatase D-like protein